jgi:hypothetical protein
VEQVVARVSAAVVEGILQHARGEPLVAQALISMPESPDRPSAWPRSAARRA